MKSMVRGQELSPRSMPASADMIGARPPTRFSSRSCAARSNRSVVDVFRDDPASRHITIDGCALTSLTPSRRLRQRH
jgi:hypothetical protein